MKSHPFDATSFIAGLVFAAVAGAYLAAELSDWTIDGRWVLPAVLIGLGAAGIVGALSGLRRSTDPSVTPSGTTAAPTEDEGAPARLPE